MTAVFMNYEQPMMEAEMLRTTNYELLTDKVAQVTLS